jgi:hypothetical protein
MKQINSARSSRPQNREYHVSGHLTNEINNTGSFETPHVVDETRTISSGSSSNDEDLSNNGEDFFAPPVALYQNLTQI